MLVELLLVLALDNIDSEFTSGEEKTDRQIQNHSFKFNASTGTPTLSLRVTMCRLCRIIVGTEQILRLRHIFKLGATRL